MEDDSLGRSIVDRERAEIVEGGRLGCANPEYYSRTVITTRARGSKISPLYQKPEEEQISIDEDEDRGGGGGGGGRNLESVNLLSELVRDHRLLRLHTPTETSDGQSRSD